VDYKEALIGYVYSEPVMEYLFNGNNQDCARIGSLLNVESESLYCHLLKQRLIPYQKLGLEACFGI
jgi:hypothetical protein